MTTTILQSEQAYLMHEHIRLETGSGSRLPPRLSRPQQAPTACFRSDDHREGVAAFLERRPPRFTGS